MQGDLVKVREVVLAQPRDELVQVGARGEVAGREVELALDVPHAVGEALRRTGLGSGLGLGSELGLESGQGYGWGQA